MDAPELRGDDGPGGWRAVWMYPRYGTRRECLGIVRDGKLTRPSKGVFDALQSALPATNGPTGATSMCCHWIHAKIPRGDLVGGGEVAKAGNLMLRTGANERKLSGDWQSMPASSGLVRGAHGVQIAHTSAPDVGDARNSDNHRL